MQIINTLASDKDQIQSVIDFLKAKTSIKFEYYQEKFLHKRINFRLNRLNINSYPEYVQYIQANPHEIDTFLEKFTINYSYFFRNYEIYERIKQLLDFNKLSSNKRINIWSCPCATGEEPYSLAMFFDGLKKKYPNFPEIKIVASDIDKNSIEHAKEGVYSEYSVHETPNLYLKHYFEINVGELGPTYKISEKIKDMVDFIQEDLIQGHKKRISYDIIFCRNLLIYIHRDLREKLLNLIESKLKPGGLLVLGMSESLPNFCTNFTSVDIKNRFYVKNFPSLLSLFNRNQIDFKNDSNSKLWKRETTIIENKGNLNKSTGSRNKCTEIIKNEPKKEPRNREPKPSEKKNKKKKNKLNSNKNGNPKTNQNKKQPDIQKEDKKSQNFKKKKQINRRTIAKKKIHYKEKKIFIYNFQK